MKSKLPWFVVPLRSHPQLFSVTMQKDGTAPQSISRSLIEEVQAKYGGTSEEAEYEGIAKNVAGVSYAGPYHSFVLDSL